MILLDSDVLIEIFDKFSKKRKVLLGKLKQLEEELVTTAINLDEVLYGIYKVISMQRLAPDHPLWRFPALPFTVKDADVAAQLEVKLERQGKKKPRGDNLIAAIDLNNGCKLFTLNKTHFSDIPRLELFDD